MAVIAMGVGNAYMGRRTVEADGTVISETPARWEEDTAGGCVAIWQMDPETMKPNGAAEIFGDWDAARYLARALELLRPNRKINIPDLPAIIREAENDGRSLCDYCQSCDCRDCIVNEWKGDTDDE